MFFFHSDLVSVYFLRKALAFKITSISSERKRLFSFLTGMKYLTVKSFKFCLSFTFAIKYLIFIFFTDATEITNVHLISSATFSFVFFLLLLILPVYRITCANNFMANQIFQSCLTMFSISDHLKGVQNYALK